MNPSKTLCDIDGRVDYYSAFFTKDESLEYFGFLEKGLNWQHEEFRMFGKLIKMRRKSAWYANNEEAYTYAGLKRIANPWTQELKRIKDKINNAFGMSFNSCLANYYHDGNDGMGFHSDNEKEMNPDSPIVSISFGAPRMMKFKHRNGQLTKEHVLENGSAVNMIPPLQDYWKHAIPKSKKITEPRINLTFRQIL